MAASSLLPGDAGLERLLELIRNHRAIENELHHVPDMTMNEARCRVQTGALSSATLRNTAIGIIRQFGQSIPEARINFREDRAGAIKAVTGRFF